jgi:hypothetical protein
MPAEITGDAADLFVFVLCTVALAIAYGVTWARGGFNAERIRVQRVSAKRRLGGSRDLAILAGALLLCGAIPFVQLGSAYLAWYIAFSIGVVGLYAGIWLAVARRSKGPDSTRDR